MTEQTVLKEAAQAEIEDFNGIFQKQVRSIVRDGLLAMFDQEVTALCGESYRPSVSLHRRAGNETVTIQHLGQRTHNARRLLLVRDGSDAIAKAVRHFWPDAVQQECLVHIEIGKVCRWNAKTDQLARWMGVALLRAQEGFRRVRGHNELGRLAAALERSGSAALSLRSSSAPPDLSGAEEKCELARGNESSYQMSISQPADILTI
jgi:hypothetical protein